MNKVEVAVRDEVVVRYPHANGFAICVLGGRNPERDATLGATLSRNPGSMPDRLADLSSEQVDRVVGVYFKKYGHSSIGGIGQLPPLTIEGVSMVDAMRVIDFPLFAGQEASTRYIDFSDSSYSLPYDFSKSSAARGIVQEWFVLYREVRETLFNIYVDGGMSRKDAKPKAFDIARAFLPIAAKTSVYINANIRQLIEQAWQLQASEYPLTQNIGNHLLRVIDVLCPNSVRGRSREEFEKRRLLGAALAGDVVWDADVLQRGDATVSFANFDADAFTGFESASVGEMERVLKSDLLKRMLQSRLTDELAWRYGMIRAQGAISFGSLRDLYRHRPYAKTWCVPGLHEQTKLFFKKPIFSPWCLAQVSDSIASRAHDLIDRAVQCACVNEKNRLYLFPMGIQTFFEMTGPVHKWLYLLRLRSGAKVHPEVRKAVHGWAELFAQAFNASPSDFAEMTAEADYSQRSKDE